MMLVVYVNDYLHGDAATFGWLMAAQAVGGLLGGVVIGRFGGRLDPLRLVAGGSILLGLGDLGIFNAPLMLPGLLAPLALFVVVGVPAAGFGAGMLTLLQRATSDAYRGRVFGAYQTAFALLALAGMALAGVLAEYLPAIVVLNGLCTAWIAAGIAALALPRESALGGESGSVQRVAGAVAHQ